MNLLLVIFFIYLLIIAHYGITYKRAKHRVPIPYEYISHTLIICCHNEEENLPKLFDAIDHQSIQIDHIIFANDHSTDETALLLQHFCNKHTNAICFNTEKRGKKNALIEAITKAHSEYILLTDADTIPAPTWIEEMVSYCATEKPDLLLAPVVMKHNHNFFTRFQALDFSALVATGAAATLTNNPLFGNGANMAVKRSKWLENASQLQTHIPSGDDVFMIHAIKKSKGTIHYHKSPNAIVYTNAAKDLKSLLLQRQRWGAKTTAYSDRYTQFIALLVALANIYIALLIPFGFSHASYLMPLSLLAIKSIVDSQVVFPFLEDTKQNSLKRYWIATSIIYPYYLSLSVLLSLYKAISQQCSKKKEQGW